MWDQLTGAKYWPTQTQYKPTHCRPHHYPVRIHPLHVQACYYTPLWLPLQTEVNAVRWTTSTRCRQPPRPSYNTAAWPSPRSCWTRRVISCSPWTVERATWRPAIVEHVLPVGCQLVTLCTFNCGSWRTSRSCTTSSPVVWRNTSSYTRGRGRMKFKVKTPACISAETHSRNIRSL